MKTKENMKKDIKKYIKNSIEKSTNNIFYKLSPSGISLIVLVITIIVIIILAAAVILTLNKNNPIEEANRARYESDVANMQAIFTNVVTKVMAQNQSTIEINAGSLNSVKSGGNSTEGRVNYTVNNPLDSSNENGVIVFNAGNNTATTYYTGKMLPLYSSGETTWYVDSEGVISLKVGELEYGNGSKNDELAGEIEGEEIVASDNPMLQSWWNDKTTDFHAEEYRTKITKAKFAVNVKVPNSKIASWDVSDAKDKSVIAWIEDDDAEGYILTIAGKDKIVANSNSGDLFENFIELKEIENIELLDVSNAKNMSGMFEGCQSLTNLDLSGWNTSNVTRMVAMFYNCASLENINLSGNFNTSKVTDMGQIFNICMSLKSINLSNFDIGNLTSTYNMFRYCKSLTNLDLSSFNTSNITVMEGMFEECTNLKSINFGQNFDISNVTRMNNMFYRCNNLIATITIQNNTFLDNTNVKADSIFEDAARVSPAQITLNYSTGAESIVDRIINSKGTSNLVKGVQV